MKTGVIAVAIVTVVILIAGCSMGNGNGPNLGDTSTTNTDTVAAHWNEIQYGMTRDQVIGILGTPDDSQHMETDGLTNDCIYYGASYQFCFTNGSLDTKNQY